MAKISVECCPFCGSPLQEIELCSLPSVVRKAELTSDVGLWCSQCQMWWERDGRGGLYSEPEFSEGWPKQH